MTSSRDKINQYRRNRRQQSCVARLTAEAKAVDPKTFLNNPRLLTQVRGWIDMAGEEYARKTLAELESVRRESSGF